YFGEVRQRTGEDWKDVRLVLSTARPSVGARRPEVLPLRIASTPIEGGAKGKGIAVREVTRENAPPAPEPASLAGAGVPAPAEAPSADPFLAAASQENATSATFYVPGQAAIPADGRPHKVPVTGFRDRAETSFETVPRLQRFVYLKASARNGSPYPMLAGPVDIFRSSGFIGT